MTQDGLQDKYRQAILDILTADPDVQRVVLFGSRAMGTFTPTSDIDIALFGPALTIQHLGKLSHAIEQSTIPQTVDLLIYDQIESKKLIQHIKKHGVKWFDRNDPTPKKTGKHSSANKVAKTSGAGGRSCGMGSEWRVSTIESICTRVTTGGTPSRRRPDYFENGTIPWFKTGELQDRLLYESEEHITVEALESSSAKIFPIHTVLMAMYGDGDTITNLGVLLRPAATNQACCAMIVSPSVCDWRYLFYALKHTREALLRVVVGGAQRNLSGTIIRQHQIPLPPLPEQHRIAHILGTLDDKIELNRRMNRTLEQMAAAIFKSWFIDFDPVHAKANGHQPTGIDPATAKLFPSEFEESVLGVIPKGWSIEPLANMIDLFSGGTPKTSEPAYWSGDISWYSVKDAPLLSDVWVIQTEKTITQRGIDNSAAKVLPMNTTIISARGTVGKLALTAVPMAMNQSCYGVRGKKGYADFFTYYLLRRATGELQQRTHGSVFDTITRDTFKTLECVSPPKKLTIAFDSVVTPLLSQIRSNLQQSRTLASLRDTLLPKLLSGEMPVPLAEDCEGN